MDALQELQLNRIARTQHLQKGENTFGFGVMQEEGIEKAHQVGEIKVGSDGIKRVWTQLANGKFDWRRVKKEKRITDVNDVPEKDFKRFVSFLQKKDPDSEDAFRYLDEEEMSDKELEMFRVVAEHFRYGGQLNDSTRKRVAKWANLALDEQASRRKAKEKEDNKPKQTEDEGSEKHEHEYKIEDAEKYVDKSNASSAEKKVAKYILLGNSEEEIKQMMARAKVDSSVVDHVYKLGKKLASEAEDEAKRVYKGKNKKEEEKPEEKTDKPTEKPKGKEPEQTKSAFSDEDVKKLTDKGYKKMSESDMAANEPEGENWVDAYFKEEEFGDGGVKTTILADLGDGTYSAHTLKMADDGNITSEVQDNILSVDEHLDGKPKFKEEIPYAIRIMTNLYFRIILQSQRI